MKAKKLVCNEQKFPKPEKKPTQRHETFKEKIIL